MARSEVRLSEHIVGQPSDYRLLGESRFGLQFFHTCKHSSKLVLPPTSRGEELLKHKGSAAYFIFIPCKVTEVADGSEHGGCEDGAGAQSASFRHGREQRNLKTTTKILELLLQAVIPFGAELGQESGKCECRFRYGEWTSHMFEVRQLLVCADDFAVAEVNAPQHDVPLFGRSDESLQGLLSVQVDGEVHHIASFHQTVRRRVRPSTRNINSHGRPSPHNLVGIDRHAWQHLLLHDRFNQSLT